MAKIVVEHVTKKPKVKLNVFVNEKKVGQIRNQVPLEVDVPAGEHLLHIGFGPRKVEGVGVPFSVAEGATKNIKTGLTTSALFAARWHIFPIIVVAGIWGAVGGSMLAGGRFIVTSPILAIIWPVLAIANYVFVNAKRRQNPKNYIEIEVLE